VRAALRTQPHTPGTGTRRCSPWQYCCLQMSVASVPGLTRRFKDDSVPTADKTTSECVRSWLHLCLLARQLQVHFLLLDRHEVIEPDYE
jgi:hypothetical protein